MNTIIYVKTKNDVNGNPRRGWIIPGAGQDRADVFIDEGHEGRWALYRYLHMNHTDDRQLRMEFNASATEVILDITVSQYNKLKKGKA